MYSTIAAEHRGILQDAFVAWPKVMKALVFWVCLGAMGLMACQSSLPPTNQEHGDFRFHIPKGWTMTESESPQSVKLERQTPQGTIHLMLNYHAEKLPSFNPARERQNLLKVLQKKSMHLLQETERRFERKGHPVSVASWSYTGAQTLDGPVLSQWMVSFQSESTQCAITAVISGDEQALRTEQESIFDIVQSCVPNEFTG